MEPYLSTDKGYPASAGNRKAKNHVGRNPQLPPVLEALQCEPQRAEPARRPRIGRYWHHPIGHSAGRVGQRKPLTAQPAYSPDESARPVRALSRSGNWILARGLDPVAWALRRSRQGRVLHLDAQQRGTGVEDDRPQRI